MSRSAQVSSGTASLFQLGAGLQLVAEADKLNEALDVLPAIATQLERLNDAIEQHYLA